MLDESTPNSGSSANTRDINSTAGFTILHKNRTIPHEKSGNRRHKNMTDFDKGPQYAVLRCFMNFRGFSDESLKQSLLESVVHICNNVRELYL